MAIVGGFCQGQILKRRKEESESLIQTTGPAARNRQAIEMRRRVGVWSRLAAGGNKLLGPKVRWASHEATRIATAATPRTRGYRPRGIVHLARPAAPRPRIYASFASGTSSSDPRSGDAGGPAAATRTSSRSAMLPAQARRAAFSRSSSARRWRHTIAHWRSFAHRDRSIW